MYENTSKAKINICRNIFSRSLKCFQSLYTSTQCGLKKVHISTLRKFLDNLLLLFFLVDFSWETYTRVFRSGGLLELGTAFFGGLFLGNKFKSFFFRWTVYILVMLDCWNLVLLFLLVDFSFRWTVYIVVMVETTLTFCWYLLFFVVDFSFVSVMRGSSGSGFPSGSLVQLRCLTQDPGWHC